MKCPYNGFSPCIGSDCALWKWSIVQIKDTEVHLGLCNHSASGRTAILDPGGRRSGDYYTEEEHRRRLSVYGNRKTNSEHKAPKKAGCWVYFIEATKPDKRGPIKIGYSKNPAARLKSLQVSTADTLVLLGTLPGDQTLEARLHNQLKAHRISGEWFHPAAKVLAALKEQGG